MANELGLMMRKNKWKMPMNVFFKDARLVFKWDKLGKEILGIAFPAALAVAADPIASLIDTIFVGHIGAIELAAVGVSVAIFNQASRITIFPLVSITTSFVAEEDTIRKTAIKPAKGEIEKKHLAENGQKRELTPQDETKKENTLEKSSTNSLTSNETRNPAPENGTIQDLEKNASGEKSEELEKKSSKQDGKKESMPENATLENVEKDSSTNKSEPPAVSTPTVKSKKKEKKQIASASTALMFGTVLGLLQAIFLAFGAKFLLNVMGVKQGSPMLAPAMKYLVLRSLGAPAVLLSLAMQGIFRGFKDTRTPLYVIVLGYATNIILDPILIFVCHLGVKGAAIAHVLSQYLIVLVLAWRLMQKVNLLPPSLKELQFGRFLRNGSLLLARVIAVTFCVTLAASMAARLGPTPMAAFQTCLQVWMTSSLLADGLAVAGQAILACAFAEKDYEKTTATATRVLQMSFVLGVGLAVVVAGIMYFGAGIFSGDAQVQALIHIGVPFVAATQPMNSLAFVFDGVNFGASDFAYSAYSLTLVAIATILSLFLLSKSYGFVGIWTALAIYMALRTLVGLLRMGSGTGPWRYLKGSLLP
ncbi:protein DETOXIFICATION 43-like [Momordica charantia]|uniref:Protein DETOXIFICATION n=1 Tax=Momordica charantia TaxID=3673 RepID=A0A6J1DGM6_MOMCH|nr:protein DETOXIFICATION 43-like [Momordica charantia]